jgi:hypothetical protein
MSNIAGHDPDGSIVNSNVKVWDIPTNQTLREAFLAKTNDINEDYDDDEHDANNHDNGKEYFEGTESDAIICNEAEAEHEEDSGYPTALKIHIHSKRLYAIESSSDTEFSEDEETEGMKLLERAAVLIQDMKGELQAVSASVDTGAASSFISSDAVDLYGLKERPLRKDDIKEFTSPVGHEKCKPSTFVIVPVKCPRLGLDKFVVAKLRVLDSTRFEIIFGRPFISKHHILAKLPKFDRSGNPLWTLKGQRTEGM